MATAGFDTMLVIYCSQALHICCKGEYLDNDLLIPGIVRTEKVLLFIVFYLG